MVPYLALSWLYLGLLLAAAGVHHARRAATLGRILAVERVGNVPALLGTAALLVLTLYASRRTPEILGGEVLPSVGLLLLGLWLAPRRSSRACGADGVQVGWHLVRLAELVEWRLGGQHLRLRWDGTWRAVRIEERFHGVLRAALEARAPGRESPFR